jgi:4-amino-4-deoxy-L-arabinose transferase-like glycosyltransferase
MKLRLLKLKDYLILGSIVVLGFVLRIVRLTSLPIFADEAIYVRWAQIMRAEETLRFLPLSDGKQPLFMWISIPFIKIFSNPLFAGRLVSVSCGVASIIGVYLISKHLFKSQKVAIISALMIAVCPFMLFFDRMALVDSMLTTFAVWLFYFLTLNARLLRLDLSMIAGFLLGGALLTKSPGLFFAILTPLAAILVSWPKEKKLFLKTVGKFIFLILITLAIGYGLYNILRLGPNFSMLSSRNMDYVYPYTHILTSPFSPLVSHLGAAVEYFWLFGPAALIALFLIGSFNSFRFDWKKTIWILLWIFFPLLAVTEYGKVFTARYILYIVPFVILIAGVSFLIKKEILVRGLTVLFLVFLVQSTIFNYLLLTNTEKVKLPRSERSGYLEEWTAGYGIKEISEIIREEYAKNPQKKIVVGTEGYFGTLPDGLQLYLNDLKEITVIGVGLGIDKLPKQLVESKQSGNKTYLVVNSSRLLARAENIGLEIVASYPKVVKPDGSREALLLFEVKPVADKGAAK